MWAWLLGVLAITWSKSRLPPTQRYSCLKRTRAQTLLVFEWSKFADKTWPNVKRQKKGSNKWSRTNRIRREPTTPRILMVPAIKCTSARKANRLLQPSRHSPIQRCWIRPSTSPSLTSRRGDSQFSRMQLRKVTNHKFQLSINRWVCNRMQPTSSQAWLKSSWIQLRWSRISRPTQNTTNNTTPTCSSSTSSRDSTREAETTTERVSFA